MLARLCLQPVLAYDTVRILGMVEQPVRAPTVLLHGYALCGAEEDQVAGGGIGVGVVVVRLGGEL